VDELVTIPAITKPPVRFWLWDLQAMMANNSTSLQQQLQNATFEQQLQVFLSSPVNHKLYRDEMVLDENGVMLASRTQVSLEGVDQLVVTQQIAALEDQRAVSARQPVNQGGDDWAFFTFATQYYLYEFFARTGYEVAYMTILGVIAISVVTFLFVPHWTAVMFVAPLICMLYIDLLGVLQFSGLHINGVIFVSLVMSIGLLVDFLLHVLLRYYECSAGDRDTKVKETLRTMGSSILVGALSTFLGVMPLAFSTSSVFNAIFTCFLALVTLGAAHGLILLPVLLSIFGPKVSTRT